MAPNKLDKHIKKELRAREIQPSSKAWEQLSEKLDATAPQSSKKGYLWYGIAASFVGILIVSILYVNNEETQIISDVQAVDSSEEENKETNDLNTEILIRDNTEIKIAETTINTTESKVIKESIKDVKQGNLVVDIEDKITSFEENVSITEENQLKVALSDEIINTKILEVIAQVNILEEETNTLTDSEVDSLLRTAQEEVYRDKFFNKNKSVDAMALLTEVEDELDSSFKDQIFKSLKAKFLETRTAVASRNK